MQPPPVYRGRSFERLVNFSDGVVAVAVTVLVLPIVDIAAPGPGQNMWDVIRDNMPQLIAFVVTFYVVIMLWRAHHRLFGIIDGYDSPVFVLNILWLMTIAILPWPGNLIEDYESFSRGVWALYFGVLALNTTVMVVMFRYVSNRPGLWRPGITVSGSSGTRGLVFTGVFIAMAVLSLYAPVLIGVAALALPLMSFVLPRTHAEEAPAGDEQAPPAA